MRQTCCLLRKDTVGPKTKPSPHRDGSTNKAIDLIRYCVKEDVPFTTFEDWSTILDKVKEIVDGKTTVHEAAKEGYEQYKRGEVGLNGHAK